MPKDFIKTVTVDNYKAFAKHKSFSNKLDANVYLTRPYTSQDKGTVENRIGVLRRFFPEGTDLRAVDDLHFKKFNVISTIDLFESLIIFLPFNKP